MYCTLVPVSGGLSGAEGAGLSGLSRILRGFLLILLGVDGIDGLGKGGFTQEALALGYGPAALLDHLLALGHGGFVLGLALGHHGFILLALGFHLPLLFRLGGRGRGFVLLFLSGLDEAGHTEILLSGLLRRGGIFSWVGK